MNFEESVPVEEQKKIALDILLDIAEFCDEHGLRYFLAYGTLIGAVRHKGYIPWDDDIDIQMPREDYNKLVEIYNEQKKNEHYELIDPYSKKSRHTFVKVIDTRTVKLEPNVDYKFGYLGIDIDIFPLDGMPSNDVKYNEWHKALQKIYSKHFFCIMESKKNIKRRIGVPLIKLTQGGKNGVLRRAKKLHDMYPYDSCDFVGCMEADFNLKGNRARKTAFENSVEIEFEGHLLKAPAGYDEILTNLFGDYMTPPENPETHHTNQCYYV